MQRRHHYEQAFESYLRSRRIPYVAVDEARKALLPENARLTVASGVPSGADAGGVADRRIDDDEGSRTLKSFDLVIYNAEGAEGERAGGSVGGAGAGRGGTLAGWNLLVDVKGRKIAPRSKPTPEAPAALRTGRLENWVTEDDVSSLATWEELFGAGFRAAFVFVYWCDVQPPDGLFQEVFEHRARWYAVRTIALGAYRSKMKIRSPRWRTVHLSTADFEKLSEPFARG